MRLSIILPTGGNDHLRNRNFNECLSAIKNQTFTDYEVIVVEQALDGNFYKRSNPIIPYKHIAIKDPQNRGFNLSWCRNVGAREANGELIVLMDSDFVFENNYFTVISQFAGEFAAGEKHTIGVIPKRQLWIGLELKILMSLEKEEESPGIRYLNLDQ